MKGDLTRGPVMKTMLLFAVPMILGNLLQQCYNIADTMVVGRALGPDALAAVGSSFTLMTFLTSILLGLCMGSGAIFSIRFGQKDYDRLRESIFTSFTLIALLTLLLNLLIFTGVNWILSFLQVPPDIREIMREYLKIIFFGLFATFLYNFFASLLRALGNSAAPLLFLGSSAVINIALDLWFVLGLEWGVQGAAAATVIAQYVSGIGIAVYCVITCPFLRFTAADCKIHRSSVREIAGFSSLTCLQQSVMNLGILMVQGLVNSFGATVMAAFAAAVKIDAFAYMPVQDFGNAFSTFIAQNHGAGKTERIHSGLKAAVQSVFVFCVIISAAVFFLANPLMEVFVGKNQASVITVGAEYLRIEGAFYLLIGILFLFYGFFRALEKPGISVLLTIISLGTRVILAYTLSSIPNFGAVAIWWSVPIGWLLADISGILLLRRLRKQVL